MLSDLQWTQFSSPLKVLLAHYSSSSLNDKIVEGGFHGVAPVSGLFPFTVISWPFIPLSQASFSAGMQTGADGLLRWERALHRNTQRGRGIGRKHMFYTVKSQRWGAFKSFNMATLRGCERTGIHLPHRDGCHLWTTINVVNYRSTKNIQKPSRSWTRNIKVSQVLIMGWNI